MSNPMITVINALYGAPGATVDVTAAIQGIFDKQYSQGIFTFTLTIGYGTFGTLDPAPGVTKSFTIVYNLPQVGSDVFMRGAQDNQQLTLTAGPARAIQVKQAIYAANNTGLDVTEKLNAYLRDPGNSTTLLIASQSFHDALTDGCDIAPYATKCFSVSYTVSPDQDTKYVCGEGGQTVNIV